MISLRNDWSYKILSSPCPCGDISGCGHMPGLSGTSSHFKIYIPGMPRLATLGGCGGPARGWGMPGRGGALGQLAVTIRLRRTWSSSGDTSSDMGKFSLARLVMCAKYQRLTSEDYVRLGLCLPDNCQDCAQGHGHYVKNDKMVSKDPSSENHCQKVPKYFDDSVKKFKSSWKLGIFDQQAEKLFDRGQKTGLFSQLQISAMCWNPDKILKL